MGRGSRVTFRKVQVSFDNKLDHIYIKPALSFWERMGNALRILRGYISNGATEEQMQATRGRLGDMMKKMQQFTPETGLKEVEEAKQHVDIGINQLNGDQLHLAVKAVNEVLRLGLRADASFSNQAYHKFVVEACSGGASAGHAIVKAFERDSGVSYEDQISTMQQEQGITVETRMHSRAYLWGVQKWRAHKMQFDEELKDMQAKLQAAMEDAEKLPRHKMWQLRSCLSGWPTKEGLGVDLWILKLWANLPDASLRMLLLILSLMEEGNMPMQTLMVLIGLLPKPKGG